MNLKEIIDSGILEEYVLGTLPEKEAEEITRLCAQHPELAAEVEAIEHTLLRSFSIPVKTEWKKDILGAMKEAGVQLHKEETEGHDTKIIPINGSAGKENGGSRKWFWAAASFALLFALSAAANFFLLNQNQNLSEELTDVKVKLLNETDEKGVFAANYKKTQEEYSLLFNPDFKRVEMLCVNKNTDNKSVLYWNAETGEVIWDGSSLPKLSAGEQYQLWAIVDGKPQDGGMHTTDEPTRMKDAFSAQAFAVTVEPTGGSPAPTMDKMIVYAPVKTATI